MAAVGVSMTVTGEGDASALHDAIWEVIAGWVDMYTAGDAYRIVLGYLRTDAIPTALADGTWGVDRTTLLWMFPDLGGRRSRAAAAWAHWLELALASEWVRVLELAAQHGLAITSERPTLAALLVARPGFVSLRNDLWTADEDGLSSDTKQLAIEDLDTAEHARYDEARIRCMCGPCSMLRPDDKFEKGIRGTLDDPDAASSAAWYIARWQRTSPEVLLALVTAAGTETMRTAIERYSANLPETGTVLLEQLPRLTGTPRARALYALGSSVLDDAQQAQLLGEVRRSLTGSGMAAQAAAEVAGVLRGEPELFEQVAAILDREVSEELRHQAVLGLANAHFERTPSATVRERLEREATRETEAGKLARWFLTSFPATIRS